MARSRPDAKPVIGKGMTGLLGSKGHEPARVGLNAAFQPEEALGDHVDASNRGIVDDHRIPRAQQTEGGAGLGFDEPAANRTTEPAGVVFRRRAHVGIFERIGPLAHSSLSMHQAPGLPVSGPDATRDTTGVSSPPGKCPWARYHSTVDRIPVSRSMTGR